jgi:uncharacterized protein YggE
MRKFSLILALLASSPALFAQLESNTITVFASQGASLQPDEAVFGVTVQSGLSTGLSDVLAALQGSGITQANFASVSTSQSVFAVPALEWLFSLPVPLSKMKDTVTLLTNLVTSVAQNNSGLTLSFAVEGSHVSALAAEAQTCSISALLSNAQAQAQSLASAAGLFVGRILAMSSTTSTVVSNLPPVFATSVGFVSPSLSSVTAAPPCQLTIKYALFQ